ncbi:hypothetical protein [Wenjunlia tyrosinilytica]|uniref:Uncharacterized protein n=1 Tax=Wenjunlia tyrosinilytica TaxID=1544741 RepID=A0A917ZUW3_9ACTN|nr:hypothetical protein [Wenjunlia tyrosinilytica]GGO93471.1 hypothetical protein GCM10012280_46090 [Wenjunlia tyrosinilytica]
MAFKDPLDEGAFGNLAAGTGWWYTGPEEHQYLGPTPTWRSLDGAIVRFYPGDAVCVSFAEVSANEPQTHQRAMADAEAIVYRAFRCFTVAEALKLLRATKTEEQALPLTAVAASAPDHYCSDVADAVISALFAPPPPVRAAALRAVMLTGWPQLARPLAAHALTEAEDDLASFARALANQLYPKHPDVRLVHTSDPPSPPHPQDDAADSSAHATPTPPPPPAKQNLARLLGAASGRIDWSP